MLPRRTDSSHRRILFFLVIHLGRVILRYFLLWFLRFGWQLECEQFLFCFVFLPPLALTAQRTGVWPLWSISSRWELCNIIPGGEASSSRIKLALRGDAGTYQKYFLANQMKYCSVEKSNYPLDSKSTSCKFKWSSKTTIKSEVVN